MHDEVWYSNNTCHVFYLVSFRHWEMGMWFGDLNLNVYVLSDIDKGGGKD